MTRRIDYQSRCEFGSLTRSINTLADKTGRLLAQINAARAIWWTRRTAPPR